MLLAILVSVGSTAAAFMTIPQLSDATQTLRDFSITSSPSPISMEQGSTATSTITITSLNGYDLATALTVTLSQVTSAWFTATLGPTVVKPTMNGRAESTLTLMSLAGTPPETYQLNISASGGTKSHTIILQVKVISARDFTISASPSSLAVEQNASNATSLTLTSQNGFAGQVSISAVVPFAFLGVAGGYSPVELGPGGSNTTILALYASNLTLPGVYMVTIAATSGPLQHTIKVEVTVRPSAGCGPPMCGTEALGLESYVFSSSTNVTLYLRNFGSAYITLNSYYVMDPSGNQYALPAWNGPTIQPTNIGAAIILIGSSCPACTVSGTAFTFVPGNSYTVTLVTSRNSQFVFTIVR